MNKLQFLILIFALLLLNLCNALFCNSSQIEVVFFDFKIVAVHIQLLKIKKLKRYIWFREPVCITTPNYVKNGQTVAEIL